MFISAMRRVLQIHGKDKVKNRRGFRKVKRLEEFGVVEVVQ
jgi:hypothetical protein